MQCSLSFFYDAAIITKYCFAFLKKKTPWGGFYNRKWVQSFKTNISDGFLQEKGGVEIKLIIIWSWSVPGHCWVVSRHNFLSWKHLMVTELMILESIMCCRKHSMSCGTLKIKQCYSGAIGTLTQGQQDAGFGKRVHQVRGPYQIAARSPPLLGDRDPLGNCIRLDILLFSFLECRATDLMAQCPFPNPGRYLQWSNRMVRCSLNGNHISIAQSPFHS